MIRGRIPSFLSVFVNFSELWKLSEKLQKSPQKCFSGRFWAIICYSELRLCSGGDAPPEAIFARFRIIQNQISSKYLYISRLRITEWIQLFNIIVFLVKRERIMRKSGSLEHYADFANLSCKYSVKWWYVTTFSWNDRGSVPSSVSGVGAAV